MTREELIAIGIPLARRIAHAIRRPMPDWVDVRDLIAAGHEGLMRAVASYDPAIGEFAPYAAARIRSAVLDSLRADDWLTRYGRTRTTWRYQATHELQQELGREPESDEIAQKLGMPLADYHSVSAYLACRIDVDIERCPDNATEPPDGKAEHLEHLVQLRAAVGRLNKRMQWVLAQYYEYERTQLEIGTELGVTESRVCQIMGEAEAALRAILVPDAQVRAPRRSIKRGLKRGHHNARTAEAAE